MTTIYGGDIFTFGFEGILKRWNGTAWVAATAYDLYIWDGSAWQPVIG